MSIQQDVLDCIGPNGVGAKELRARLGNVAQSELDVCTNALMRSGKIALSFGQFQLNNAMRRATETVIPVSIPSAAQEAAASLQPATLACKTCQNPQPECEFRAIGPGRKRAEECNTCHGKKVTGGLPKVRGEPAKSQPVIADRVIEKISAECSKATEEIARQEASIEALLQEIGVRRIEITHQVELREEREKFLALYAKFAAEVSAKS